MPSRFPGMDPFIEESAWEDFHQGMIGELSAALVPRVRPRYVVRKEKRVYVEHYLEGENRWIRSDIAILTSDKQETETDALETATAPVIVNLPVPEEKREAFLTIREHDTMEVVTVIEILSPDNKRLGSEGRANYLRKREEVLGSQANLVELDLLRGGARLPTADRLPSGDYYAFICRATHRFKAEVYPWTLRHGLPRIPVPLASDDPDVMVDLQEIFSFTYDRAGYDYSLAYDRDVDPPLSSTDAKWVKELTAS